MRNVKIPSLRPYQRDVIDSFLETEKKLRKIIVLPQGSGKPMIPLGIIAHEIQNKTSGYYLIIT